MVRATIRNNIDAVFRLPDMSMIDMRLAAIATFDTWLSLAVPLPDP
jgi:hypothetical protein